MIDLTLQNFLDLIPNYVLQIAEKLQENGYEAHLVGGSIRDVLLGKKPGDYDIATNAYPEEIEKIFKKSIPTGAKFGTITVVMTDEEGEPHNEEVTTYRSEADYFDGRWPAKVEFTKTIKEDLARRDLTINAIALDLQNFDNPEISIQQILVDPFDGVSDLRDGVIRAVGDPIERFTEDGLRPVRACRLAAQLQFEVDTKTFDAIKKTLHIVKKISIERFRDELNKLLMRSPKPSIGLKLMKESGILELFIPELLEGIGVEQPEYHVDDVFEHSVKTVDHAEDSVKLAALFHDIGKPRCMSVDESGTHFYGHDMEGAKMTKEIMKRLKYSNAEIDRTARLVRWHMFYYPSADWRKENKVEEIEVQKNNDSRKGQNPVEYGWSDSAVRRLIKNVGGQDAIDDLMQLRIADAGANPKSEFNPKEIDALTERIADVRAKEMALSLNDLDISGTNLIQEFGIEPGPKVGKVLNYLLDLVIEEPFLNKKETLLEKAKIYLKNNKDA